ncbi:MAG TPA: substrate-binding domain-containing protein [Cyclobacteriaceae bacterium]|nr:substrate-binding domain-containing protein [Cyclobacteriaceae bacterium]
MKRTIYFTVLFWALTFLFHAESTAQKVGLLMDSYVIDRWYIDQKLFTDRIKELGGTCQVEIPYGDPDEQVRLGKKLIQDGVDVLVIVPSDSRKAAEIVEAAKAKKIPVISYDRLILSKELSFYISYNNVEVGHLQAQYVLNKVPKGNYLLINGPPTDNNAILFRKGQLEILKPSIDKGDIKLIGDIVLNDWSEIEALMRIDDFFSSTHEKPDVIIAANDALATGCIQALPADLVGKVLITGQDAELIALKNIIGGTQAMTVYKPIKPLAHQAAEIAMTLAKKGSTPKNKTKLKNDDFEVDALLLKPVVVDKSNYKETVVKDGHITLSEIMESKK